jgi:hypothetical protein
MQDVATLLHDADVSEVRIEAPDPTAATLLQGRLPTGAELVSLPGRCELRTGDVPLADLPRVLATIETWMAEEGIGSVAVRLDERRYVLVRGV